MTRDYGLFLDDINVSLEKIEKYLEQKNYDDFTDDLMLNDAILRNLEIIGEATKNIPEEIRLKYDLPWKKMAGLRDIVVHKYFGIDNEIIWQIVKDNLPSIKPTIIRIINEIKNS